MIRFTMTHQWQQSLEDQMAVRAEVCQAVVEVTLSFAL